MARTPPQDSQGPSAIWVNAPEEGTLPNGVSHRTFYSQAHVNEIS